MHSVVRIQRFLVPSDGLFYPCSYVDASSCWGMITTWLEEHGYSRSLRNKYVGRGWLDQVTRSVYRRPAPALQGEARQDADRVQIKIEVTPVLRGCVYEPAVKPVSARVEAQFGFA